MAQAWAGVLEAAVWAGVAGRGPGRRMAWLSGLLLVLLAASLLFSPFLEEYAQTCSLHLSPKHLSEP